MTPDNKQAPGAFEEHYLARTDQIRRRLTAQMSLHSPAERKGLCKCGRSIERCGTWTDMQSLDWLLDEVDRMHTAGRTVHEFSVIRPADGYESVVYNALNVFGEHR